MQPQATRHDLRFHAVCIFPVRETDWENACVASVFGVSGKLLDGFKQG
jgi:hypothetical protein